MNQQKHRDAQNHRLVGATVCLLLGTAAVALNLQTVLGEPAGPWSMPMTSKYKGSLLKGIDVSLGPTSCSSNRMNLELVPLRRCSW